MAGACLIAFAPLDSAMAKRLLPDQPSVEVHAEALDQLRMSMGGGAATMSNAPAPPAVRSEGGWQAGLPGQVLPMGEKPAPAKPQPIIEKVKPAKKPHVEKAAPLAVEPVPMPEAKLTPPPAAEPEPLPAQPPIKALEAREPAPRPAPLMVTPMPEPHPVTVVPMAPFEPALPAEMPKDRDLLLTPDRHGIDTPVLPEAAPPPAAEPLPQKKSENKPTGKIKAAKAPPAPKHSDVPAKAPTAPIDMAPAPSYLPSESPLPPSSEERGSPTPAVTPPASTSEVAPFPTPIELPNETPAPASETVKKKADHAETQPAPKPEALPSEPKSPNPNEETVMEFSPFDANATTGEVSSTSRLSKKSAPGTEKQAKAAAQPAPAENVTIDEMPSPAPSSNEVLHVLKTPTPAPMVVDTIPTPPDEMAKPLPAEAKPGMLPTLKSKMLHWFGKDQPAPPSTPPSLPAERAPMADAPSPMENAPAALPDIAAEPASADKHPLQDDRKSPPTALPALTGESAEVPGKALPSLDSVTKKNDKDALAMVQRMQNKSIDELPPLPSEADMQHGPTKLPKLPEGGGVAPPSKVESALDPVESKETASLELPSLPKQNDLGKPSSDTSPGETRMAMSSPPPAGVMTKPADSSSAPSGTMPAPKDIVPDKKRAPAAPAALQVTFAQSETEVPISSQQGLRDLSKKLAGDKESQISVVAYASGPAEQGSTARRVSLARALAVRAFLIDLGIDNMRINVQAKGNQLPAGDKGSNERVDVFVE